MKWFQNVKDISELRNLYKKLLLKYHPDNNPGVDTTKAMQEVNAEYDLLLKQLKSADTSYKEAEGFSEDELKKVLQEVIRLKADITIEIIGTWIWIEGNTYPIKDRLKELGFRWSKQKKMWYCGTLTHSLHTSMPIDYIRMKYGSKVYKNKDEERQVIHTT